VCCGLVVGYTGAKIAGTPSEQIRGVLAACGFANSTGLPITLLTVVHTNFPSTTELGRIDPTLFLSVYLLTYPMLQWSIGGWLLAPDQANDDDPQACETEQTPLSPGDNGSALVSSLATISSPLGRNVLNNRDMEAWYRISRRGIGETDASLYISTVDLVQLGADAEQGEEEKFEDDIGNIPVILSTFEIPPPPPPLGEASESSRLLDNVRTHSTRSINFASESMWETFNKILSRVLQPPVIGALAGIIVAATPLRGILVDIEGRSSNAPLQFMFDGLYSVGLAAVPINMIILGVNLSQSQLSSSPKSALLSTKTMISIVLGKMLVMPAIGVLSALLLRAFVLKIPDDIDSSFYLVLMIVFITPTANNVMVMVELSGGAREGISRVIAWQYAAAPLLLSLTMTTAVGVASQWS
jgi:predicted permease